MNDEEFKRVTKQMILAKRPHEDEVKIDMHHESSMHWGPENFALASEWLTRTVLIIKDPSAFYDEYVFTNFFGILDHSELSKFLKMKTYGMFKLLEIDVSDIKTQIAKFGDEPTREYYRRLFEASDLLEQVRKYFSEDEKFLLRYIRHRYCHATLSEFMVKIDGTGEESKYKTANWETLVKLAHNTSVPVLRDALIEKLKPHLTTLRRIAYLMHPGDTDRLVP